VLLLPVVIPSYLLWAQPPDGIPGLLSRALLVQDALGPQDICLCFFPAEALLASPDGCAPGVLQKLGVSMSQLLLWFLLVFCTDPQSTSICSNPILDHP
jgi:hypothetical protein